jgi:hypothetical protein
MASRKVPEPLSSALETTKFFPIGSVGAGVDGTIVSVGPAVISAGPVAVLAGDGLAPQAFSVRKRIAERKNIVNILLIVFSISSRTINYTDFYYTAIMQYSNAILILYTA